MSTLFTAADGTKLAYHRRGKGPVLVCVPGGPGRASSYLGDLGGLTDSHELVVLDNRGTGDSADSADPTAYRCDRLVDDVEALRAHLGLERMNLLGHSAGGNIAILYAARFAERLNRLVLVTPGLRAVGLDTVGFEEAIEARSAEPWFPTARSAMDDWQRAATEGRDYAEIAPLRMAAAPFAYGKWNAITQAHAAAEPEQRSRAAAEGFYAGFDPDTAAVREALRAVTAPVLVVAGALDPAPTPAAARPLVDLFPDSTLGVQPQAGHFPWVDDPKAFIEAVGQSVR